MNSTPSDATKKTASALKIFTVAGLQALAIVFVMASVLGWLRGHTVPVRIGTVHIQAEVAATESERAKGLSAKTYLAENHGMLFVFPQDAKWQMWMQDMKLPLDIVWLDANKTVVSVRAQVRPDSYPDHFGPPVPARYVLELASGMAQKAHIEPGVRADFSVQPATK